MLERTDKLRRRPLKVRYAYLAVSRNTLHTGVSYGGLKYAEEKHGVVELYLSDLVTKKVIWVGEPIRDFMKRWRAHYNDPEWSYEKDIIELMPVPQEEERRNNNGNGECK